MMSEAMFGVRRAWRNPALSLLQFVPVGVDQGLEVGPEAGHVIVAWEAADLDRRIRSCQSESDLDGLSTDGARRLEDLCREPSATMATH